jgi:hypothetical protein
MACPLSARPSDARRRPDLRGLLTAAVRGEGMEKGEPVKSSGFDVDKQGLRNPVEQHQIVTA